MQQYDMLQTVISAAAGAPEQASDGTDSQAELIASARIELAQREASRYGLGRSWLIIKTLLAELDRRERRETE